MFYQRIRDVRGRHRRRKAAWAASRWKIDDGQWHHIAGTCSESEARLYVDGEMVGKGSKAVVGANTCALTLGLGLSTPGEIYPGLPVDSASFNGIMDEVMIFNRGFSRDEIRALYDAQK